MARRKTIYGRTKRMELEYREMRQTWEKARAFLEKVGLELPRSFIPDDDPLA